jgi:ComF family protein
MRPLVSSVAGWVNAGLSLLYPEVCQLCRNARANSAEGFVCSGCREDVRFIKPPFCERCGIPAEGAITNSFECTNCRDTELHFAQARSAAVARGCVLEAIHGYKYNRALWFESFLAEVLISQSAPHLKRDNWDLIVPIPLHPTREREREFNQAERLAQRLGAATGLAVDNGLLRRIVPTRTQALLPRVERFANVRHAFAVCENRRLKGERVVLLDDVFTTGATSNACARVLRLAGAGEVCVWTVARGV